MPKRLKLISSQQNLLKADIATIACVVEDLFRTVWETEEVPEDWNCGLIVELSKKGNLTECGNWRGITLLSVPAKDMEREIITRLRDALDEMLRGNRRVSDMGEARLNTYLCFEMSSNNRWNGIQVCTSVL